jgi:hypothetical protein
MSESTPSPAAPAAPVDGVVPALGAPVAPGPVGARPPRPRIHHHLSPRRDRALFATAGFLVAVLVTRGVTTVLHYRGAGPDGGIIIHGVHIHHLVFGIVIMLLTGYLWMLLLGVDHEDHRGRSRVAATLYGVSAALILDEFALWLNLRDVYWQQQGRESLEALAGMASLLMAGILIAPFVRALRRHYQQVRKEITELVEEVEEHI